MPIAALVVLAVILGGGVLAVRMLENRFIFYPEVTPRKSTTRLLGGVRVTDVWMTTEDGVRIHGWKSGDLTASPVILFLHGNAGNITHRADRVSGLVGQGLGVLIIDYRGYGQSEGEPDEEGLYADARAAHDHLVVVEGVSPSRIVILGRSLGGAVAVNLATERTVAALIVESSFTSASDMAMEMFGPLPVHLLARSRFDSEDKVGRLAVPKLFMHGDRDDVVPHWMGKKLFDTASGPKEWVELAGADHNDAPLVLGTRYYEIIARFSREHVAQVPIYSTPSQQ